VRRLPPCLTRLDIAYIGTPVGEGSLDRLLAGLPALEFVRLHFRPLMEHGRWCDADLEEAGEYPPEVPIAQRDDFPQAVLRWVLLMQLLNSMR
jgi:hypothetical protein